MISFFVDAPATALPVALEQLGDVIVDARFDEARLEKVRGVVIEELRRRGNDSAQLARDTFMDLVLTDHPARHSPGGTAENVRAISLDALWNYRAERFRAGNMVLAVVGRAEHDEVVRRVSEALGPVPAGASPREVVPAPRSRGASCELHAGRTTTHVVLGVATPGLNSSERYPLALLAAILGRAGRRLRRELREERALTYSVSVSFGGLSDVGVLSIATGVDSERCDEAIGAINSELDHLRSGGVTDEELATAKGYLEGRTYLGEERNLAQARRISSQELLDLPLGLDDYVRRITRVSREQINAVAGEYLKPADAVYVIVRP
jgi:predicted Zn-dependent peptidase